MTTSSTPSSRAIRASRLRRSGSFDGSAIWKRRIPLRTTQRNESRITSSSAGTHEMKRMPVVMKLSGVRGIAALTSRKRSHGSSRWKRTETAMCVLDEKSHAWKPTRSSVGAIASTSGVVEAGRAPQALVAVARRRVDDVDERLTALPGSGTAARRTRRARRSSRTTSTTVPATPAGIEFIIFITSIRQTTVSGSTRAPTSTNGAAPGASAR